MTLTELNEYEQKMLLEAAKEHMKRDLVFRAQVHAAIVELFLKLHPETAKGELVEYRELEGVLERYQTDPAFREESAVELDAIIARASGVTETATEQNAGQ